MRFLAPQIHPRRLIRTAILLGTGCLLGGCAKPLFPNDVPRNQFEAYDTMRNVVVPVEEPDVFGNPQPALRARLGRRAE